MLSRTILFFLLAAAFTTARAGIDLTPRPHETTCEGFTFKELLFKDDKGQILYQLPNKWTWRAGADGVHLTPPGIVNADAVIQATPLAKPQPLDEKGIDSARQQLLASVPPGSQMIAVVKEEQNAVPFNGNPTYEIQVSYQVIGATFLRSVLFTNVGDTQLSFRLTAHKSDFEPLHDLFRRSILSWQWIEPQPKAAPVAVAESVASTSNR
jgi:hypothetical protein